MLIELLQKLQMFLYIINNISFYIEKKNGERDK